MNEIKKPTINVDGVQDTNTPNIPGIIAEIFLALGLLLVSLVKILYYIGDSIYYAICPEPPKSVKGEVVLITGTGHGIGKELALLYASEGATVVGWDINLENAKQTAKEIAQLGYPKSYAYACDVSKRENVLELAKKTRQEAGDVTILINNAGIMPTRPLLEHTTKEIENIMGINVMAHFWTLEAFLPSMQKNNHGHIVALSSMAGQVGLVNLVPYCASKFAVRGMMEALFEEERKRNSKSRIGFTTIYPFMVNTGLCKNPKIKFPNLMMLENTKETAKTIMYCQRNNIMEKSIPGHLKGIMQFIRNLPLKALLDIKDTFDAYVDTDAQ